MKKTLYLLFFLSAYSYSFAQDALTKRFDSLTKEYQDHYFNGVILIGKGNSIIYKNAFGFANQEKKMPMTVDKLFKTESVGKMFTATRIMQLVEQGKIDLSKSLAYYLPDWKIKNADKITIHQLLNHTSGLLSPWDDPSYDFKKVYSTEELKSLIENQPLAFDQPGLRFSYSNSGYVILGEIISKLDHQPFDQAIRKSIFTVAGMKQIDHLKDTVMPQTAAQPYFFYSSKDYVQSNQGVGPRASAAGGWITNASQLLAFAKTYLSGAYLKPQTRKLQYTANGTVDISKQGRYYTYGFEVSTDNMVAGKTIIGHNGGGAGFSVDVYFEPESGYMVVMCSNMYGTGRSITENYFKLLFNQAPKKVQQSSVIRSVDLIQLKGSNYLTTQPYEFFKEAGVTPSPQIVINAAENLAELKDFTNAEAFLTIAQQQYPTAPQVWYISGNVAMQQKKFDVAKTSYQTAKARAEENKDGFLTELINQKLEELNKVNQ